jgi:hypothetical protein
VVVATNLPPETKNVTIAHHFSFLAAVCQISTIIWLIRYRAEGLR